MSKPRGHIRLNGKDYIIQDGSYQSKMVPLFRPQLTIEGISHEALDQYLYMVQETWDKGTNFDARLGMWKAGGYRKIDGLNNSDPGKLRLQPGTRLVFSFATPPVKARLLTFGGFLYLFGEDGIVKRTSDGTTWNTVTYDNTTHGNITAVDVASGAWIVVGTDQGKVFLAAPGGTISPINTQDIASSAIQAVKTWRGHIASGYGTTFEVRPYSAAGMVDADAKYSTQVPGQVKALAVWSQALACGIQAEGRGSSVAMADLTQIVDTYELFGDFRLESLVSWAGFLMYGGLRPNRSSEIYTFREILSDSIEKGEAPVGVFAMLPLSGFMLVGYNEKAGLWWISQNGAGPYAQSSLSNLANSIVRSIAHFNGNVYYTVDGTGVIQVAAPPA